MEKNSLANLHNNDSEIAVDVIVFYSVARSLSKEWIILSDHVNLRFIQIWCDNNKYAFYYWEQEKENQKYKNNTVQATC